MYPYLDKDQIYVLFCLYWFTSGLKSVGWRRILRGDIEKGSSLRSQLRPDPLSKFLCCTCDSQSTQNIKQYVL